MLCLKMKIGDQVTIGNITLRVLYMRHNEVEIKATWKPNETDSSEVIFHGSIEANKVMKLNEDIEVRFAEVGSKTCKIGVQAPREIPITRQAQP